MKTLNIFIASSCELSDWRLAIGSLVQRLSEDYEKYGIRLKLKCWEDYVPEYSGKRKQDEYNEDLVKVSQIFIALFYKRCGVYTQEEVKIATSSNNIDVSVILRNEGQDITEILDFLNSRQLSYENACEVSELSKVVEKKIKGYIESHYTLASEVIKPSGHSVYLTIPNDCQNELTLFENAVRQIDYQCEEYFNGRCHLRQNKLQDIVLSDYYMALIKDEISDSDFEELSVAITNTSQGGKSQKNVIYNYPKGTILKTNDKLNDLITSSGLFTETYDNICRVKFNLLRWILSIYVLSPSERSGVDIKNDWVVFNRLPIAPLDILGITTTDSHQQLSEVLLLLSIHTTSRLTKEIVENNEALDVGQVATAIKQNKALLVVFEAEVNSTLKNLQQLRESISSEVERLLSIDDKKQHLVSLVELLFQKIEIEEQLEKYKQGTPNETLRSLLLIVQLHDTYNHEFQATEVDIDAHYKTIADFADAHNIIDPVVEVMRFNYANYLARKNLNNGAIATYEACISNMLKLRDTSNKYYRDSIVHILVTSINSLSGLGEIEKSMQGIALLESLLNDWKDILTDEEEISAKIRLFNCKIRIRPILKELNAKDVIARFDTLQSHLNTFNPNVFSSEIWDELYIDFPNCIAAFLIDVSDAANQCRNLSAAAQIEKLVVANLKVPLNSNNKIQQEYLASAYHNLGFIYSRVNTKGARLYYDQALSRRRRIFELSRDAQDLSSVAETLINIGATYIGLSAKYLPDDIIEEALGYAEEALNIYTRLNTENYLEQMTCVYKAKLLKGTILACSYEKRNLGLELITECYIWDNQYPQNSYHDTFQDTCISFLNLQ